MRALAVGAGAVVLAIGAIGATGCGSRPGAGDGAGAQAGGPPATPEAAARALFALAAEPDDAALAALFAEPGAAADAAGRVDLLEALDRLPRAAGEAVAIAGTEPLETAGRVAVDVDVAVADGAVSRYSVQVEPAEAGVWRVVWFQGPDLGWPAFRAPRGTGTSVSAGPASEGEGG